jgi:hypothetical protein
MILTFEMTADRHLRGFWARRKSKVVATELKPRSRVEAKASRQCAIAVCHGPAEAIFVGCTMAYIPNKTMLHMRITHLQQTIFTLRDGA